MSEFPGPPSSGPAPPARPVRCRRHGVFYDPSRSDGCALCGGDGARRPPPRRVSPAVRWAAVLGAVTLAFFGAGKLLRGLADSGDRVVSEARDAAGRIDPDPYRSEIEALEAAVYATRSNPFEYGSEVLQAAAALSEGLRREVGPGGRRRATATRHAQDVLLFGQRASATEGVGFALADSAATRAEWERLRSRVFREADWMRSASEVPPAPGAAGPAAASTVQGLRDVHAELVQLSRFGRSTAMALPEPSAAPGSERARRLIGDWQIFRQSWGDRLRAALQRVPDGGRVQDQDGQAARESIRRASEALMTLIQPTSPPSRSQRREYFDEADRHLETARRHLARMGA